MHESFLAAIRDRLKVTITFCGEDDGVVRTRTCYPMDFAPGRRYRDGITRYWVWDCDGRAGPHALGLLPSQIRSLELTTQQFDPAEFVAWRPKWRVARDWGAYS